MQHKLIEESDAGFHFKACSEVGRAMFCGLKARVIVGARVKARVAVTVLDPLFIRFTATVSAFGIFFFWVHASMYVAVSAHACNCRV